MPLYVFLCRCGRETEALAERGARSRECVCGETACRSTVYAPAIGGRVRPPANEREVSLRQFSEASEQLAYEHGRAEESAQRELPVPRLWSEASRRAAKLQRAGITDSLDYRPEYIRE